MSDIQQVEGLEPLPPQHASLAFGIPESEPGTIYVLSVSGGVRFRPKEGRFVCFGRNRPEVHVCLGEDDRRVSRTHGQVTRRGDHWWLANTGHAALQLPSSRMLFSEDEPLPLGLGYTPVFLRGTAHRRHLLELYVAGEDGRLPRPAPDAGTLKDKPWKLDAEERIALVSLAQRYLMHESYAQPLAWRQVAEELQELQPDAKWRPKRVEHLVTAVRRRLSATGVPGLTREEVGEPVGNMLNHNLILELLHTRTLVPPDLRLLGD
ncbi:FHA domain-containing protein [Glycomyces buryatensis]|uniref:FHA domain-containing protein n=1 Tax=Glycomyces buryatensis TaxID=2570927 RepID=A0A4S8Q7Y8_9ACTN|nr:FHA domain-containing protein [Glycomyces buryatensis]THV36979.1 FHA domain-containing protein [Glycomyces buryatensis]